MIKYAVCVDHWQFGYNRGMPLAADDASALYFSQDDLNYRTVALYDTEDEALALLEKQKISTFITEPYIRIKGYDAYVMSEVAFIEIADYEQGEDGEWEFIEGSDYDHFRFEEMVVAKEDE